VIVPKIHPEAYEKGWANPRHEKINGGLKKNSFILVIPALEKSLKKSERSRGVLPFRHCGSTKNTITPEQVIRHYLKSAGTGRGDRLLSPPLDSECF